MSLKAIIMLVTILACSCIGAIAGDPKYPQEYPAAFPQFNGCKMVQIMNFPNNTTAMLDCGNSSAEKIYSFYLDNAKQDGWEVLMENKTSDYSVFMVEKGEVAMQIQVFSEGGVTNLSLSFVKK